MNIYLRDCTYNFKNQRGPDYTIINLNNTQTLYPGTTLDIFVVNFNIFNDGRGSQYWGQVFENSTSSVFSCSVYFSSYSTTTLFVNGDSSKGSLVINNECKSCDIKIEIIQEVTWNTVHTYSSIVQLEGL
ncbi:hypothetical protein ACTA71_010759 [Dictyostelium dimigraforme]